MNLRRRRSPKGSNRTRQTRRGFVLLIVVVMLAICCTLLAQLATVSMSQAREAISSEQELQERWAIVSLRRSLLADASNLLGRCNAVESDGGSQERQREYQTISDSVVLSGRRYRFVIDAESRKLPLRSLASFRPDDAATAANFLLQRTGLTVDRRGLVGPEAFQRWDSVIGTRLSPGEVLRAGHQVTLWGDGRLDLRNASADVTRQAWRAVFGTFPPKEVVDKSLLGELSWSRIRESLALREEQLETLDRHFGVESSCFSVLVQLETSQSKRTWFFVADRGEKHFAYEL